MTAPVTGYPHPAPDSSCLTIIDQLDILEVIEAGREEIARRKREHLEKPGIRVKNQ